jgi:hypothetical protein
MEMMSVTIGAALAGIVAPLLAGAVALVALVAVIHPDQRRRKHALHVLDRLLQAIPWRRSR